MSRPPDYRGIGEEVRRIDGCVRLLQVIECNCPGCTDKIEMIVKSERKPPSIIFKTAHRRGWSVNEGRRTFLCPTHARTHK